MVETLTYEARPRKPTIGDIVRDPWFWAGASLVVFLLVLAVTNPVVARVKED